MATTPPSNANYALKYSLFHSVSRTFFRSFGLLIRLTLGYYFCQMNLNSNRHNADSVTLEIGIVLPFYVSIRGCLFNCVFAFVVCSYFIFNLTQFPIRNVPNFAIIPQYESIVRQPNYSCELKTRTNEFILNWKVRNLRLFSIWVRMMFVIWNYFENTIIKFIWGSSAFDCQSSIDRFVSTVWKMFSGICFFFVPFFVCGHSWQAICLLHFRLVLVIFQNASNESINAMKMSWQF